MLIKSIPKREKIIFLIAVIVILLILCYNFVIAPLIGKIAKINNEISTNEVKLKKIKKLILEKDEITELYNKYAKEIRIKGDSDEEAVANFLANVETLARTSSVLINDIKPKPVKDLGKYKRFVFDLEVEGTTANITKFIYELENSPEAIKIERLQISVKTGRDDTLKADLTIAKLAMP